MITYALSAGSLAASNNGVDFRHNGYAYFLFFSGNAAPKSLKEIYGKTKLMQDK